MENELQSQKYQSSLLVEKKHDVGGKEWLVLYKYYLI